MFIDTIRLTEQAKNQLIKVKRKTKIENWNVLCRWAICLSLSDPKPVRDAGLKNRSSVEMSWKVFGGELADVYEALIRERLHKDNGVSSKDNLARLFDLHLHRGISYLENDYMKIFCKK